MQTPAGFSRLPQLRRMLEKAPDDTFLLYAIALEHKKAGEFAPALEYLDRVTRIDSGYCYAYHQRGLIHEAEGNVEAARQAYREGIEAATKKGDAHARDEIRAALEMIE